MAKKRFPLIWDKPGGDKGKKDPWRQKRRNNDNEDGPPDLDQVFKNLGRKFKKLLGGAGGSQDDDMRSFIGLVLGVIAVLYVVSGVYIVNPPERAVVLRFGKYSRTEAPGPHWLLPIIESKRVVNVERVSTSDHSGLMLTEDGNIVSVGVAVQYRIGNDPEDIEDYLFNVVNPVRSLNRSADSALRQVIGKSTMDDILTLRRDEIANAVKEQLVDTLKDYQTGLWVLEVVMQFAKAPSEVQEAFDEVIKASADKERLVNQARGYENEVIPRARGVAERIRNEALGYKEEKILIAKGNVERFNQLLPEYQKSTKVTQTRLYLDTMEDILSKVSKIVIDSGEGNNLIYLPLDQLVPRETDGRVEHHRSSKEHLPIASRHLKEKK